MPKKPHGRLELTWMGKDLALIPYEDGKYDYAWVEPTDPRVTEVRSVEESGTIGQVEATYGGDGRMVAAGAEDNLLIVGDSGDALRALGTIPEYADRYRGQVKLVYIDPPFNTGQTFDSYSDQMEHSVWLTFMRDRIRYIKPLMAPDASIWVHLDDVEVHRMRALLDEEFGAASFIATIVWEKDKGRRNDTDISGAHDYILIYAPLGSKWKDVRNLLPRGGSQIARYQNPDSDPRGPWLQGDNGTAKSGSEKARFPVTLPSGRVVLPPEGNFWRFSADALERARADNRVWFGRRGDSLPVIKRYLTDVQDGIVPRTLWTGDEVGTNQDAKRDHLRKMFPDSIPFSTPKPEPLIARIVEIGTNPGELVLDCFAGSGTTAAVAQKLGRRWVTIELLENTANTYTIPRLTKVIEDEDPRGISTSIARIPADGVELPDGMTPAQAQAFNTALTKVSGETELEVDVASETARLARAARKSGDSDLSDEDLVTLARLAAKLAKTSSTSIDISAKVLAPLRAATKTRAEKTVRWSGGGGFTIARLGPSMYDVEDGPEGRTEVFLSPAATNGAWSAAIAGQLGYRRTAEHPVFAGQKGRERLAVVDGVADESVIRGLHAHLAPGETMLVVAKAALEDTSAVLRELASGSTLRVAPGGLLQKGTVIR